MDVIANILNNISSYRCLLVSGVVIGILKEGMDLVNYVLILGKSYYGVFMKMTTHLKLIL